VDISLRACLTGGVATITAAAVAFGPSVQEPTPAPAPPPVVQVATRPIQLTASADYFSQLFDWWQPIFLPSASQPFPTPPSGVGPAPTSIPSTLEWAYHAVEPWVRYGFELATYAAGWVPYVGWLSGQIMIFYNFGERIVHAIAHNTLDWLNGNGSFAQNVADGVAWTIDAFIQLGIDEWNFFLPPLPPLPPFPFSAQVSGALNGVRDVLHGTVIGVLQQLSAGLPSHDPDQPPPPPIVTATVPDAATPSSDVATQANSEPQAEADTFIAIAAPEIREPKLREPKNPKSVVNGAAGTAAQNEVEAADTATTETEQATDTVTKFKGDADVSTKQATNDETGNKGGKKDDTANRTDDTGKKKADKE